MPALRGVKCLLCSFLTFDALERLGGTSPRGSYPEIPDSSNRGGEDLV